MITEEYIESLNLPDYDKWVEYIWEDSYWWEWIIEEFVSECNAQGIRIHEDRISKKVYFDLYHRLCSSNGHVRDDETFYETHKDSLVDTSPVLAQMLVEGYVYISWASTRNNYLSIDVEINGVDDEALFENGLFAGTSVQTLLDIEETNGNADNFRACVTDIIEEKHSELLRTLNSAYESDTSEETYKAWILDEIYSNLPQQPVLNKT